MTVQVRKISFTSMKRCWDKSYHLEYPGYFTQTSFYCILAYCWTGQLQSKSSQTDIIIITITIYSWWRVTIETASRLILSLLLSLCTAPSYHRDCLQTAAGSCRLSRLCTSSNHQCRLGWLTTTTTTTTTTTITNNSLLPLPYCYYYSVM